jgi:acyl transferase domain-containing protein
MATPDRVADTDVAVVAMACRFPGATECDTFWRNLREGVESIRRLDPQQLAAAGVDPDVLSSPAYVPAAPVLDDIDGFDAQLFGLTPREAQILDPQQRLFLECAWEVLELAGHDSRRFPGPIGLYAGAGVNTYLLEHLHPHRNKLDGFELMLANDKDFLATRVAYKLDLRGPAVTVQTACSTSLVAVHLAVQSLLAGECDLALAGGTSVRVPHAVGYLHREGMIASPDGHCRAFDAGAAGTVVGSGVGVVALRRLADALASGDPIVALIKGTAINNDGAAKAGFTAPAVDGQSAVIGEALAVAGVAPADIGYVETHGTGTPLGDPIELRALARVFAGCPPGSCAIGSVKTNFGHADTAAGVAGLMKVALALRHRAIPPSLHFQRPNPAFDFEGSPFRVNAALTPWPARQGPRRAGVSSFGIGGTNAHVVLEEAPSRPSSGPGRARHLLVLSAATPSALEQAGSRLAAHLAAHPQQPLADVAFTLALGRPALRARRILVGSDHDEVIRALADPARLATRNDPPGARPIAFLFPGQGSQHPGMAEALYRHEPAFAAVIDRACEYLRATLALDLRDLLFATGGAEGAAARLAQTRYTQPALFALEYALAMLWQSWGIRPQAMLGHSIGEYVAACIAGVFTLEDALEVVAERGRLMQSLPGGAMLAVAAEATVLADGIGPDLAIAADNGPGQCVLSGPRAAIEVTAASLAARGHPVKRLVTSHAFHSPMMDPLLEAFEARIGAVARQAPSIPFVSNVTGTWITAEQARSPAYWARHLRETVRFRGGLDTLLEAPRRVLLEVGPGRVLQGIARAHPGRAPDQLVLGSLPAEGAGTDAHASVLEALGGLWLADVAIDWQAFYADQRRHRVVLPTYPFEHQRYWMESSGEPRYLEAAPDTSRLALDRWFGVPSWRRAPLDQGAQGLDPGETWLVFADAGPFPDAMSAELRARDQQLVQVRAAAGFERLDAARYRIAPGRAADYVALAAALQADGREPRKILHLWSVGDAGQSPEAEVERGFYSLLFLAQAFAGRGIATTVFVLSSNAQSVAGEVELVPERATLLGPVRVIPRECEGFSCRSIDLAFPQTAAACRALARVLAAELAAQHADGVVAYRGGYRWVECFEPVRLGEVADSPFVEHGTYLMVGGLGGLGQAICDHLARSRRARLMLVSRSGFPCRDAWSQWLSDHASDDPVSRTIRQVESWESSGARIAIEQGDVCQREDMQRVLDAVRRRFGPLDGVVHAAGIAGGGALLRKAPADAAAVLAAKVRGLRVLEALCPEARLWVLNASLSGVAGEFGQVDYCAANAFLDAFAQHLHALGKEAITIDWDTWDAGMAVETPVPDTLHALRERTQALRIRPDEGVVALERAVASGLPRILVATTALGRRLQHSNELLVEALARPLARGHARPQLNNSYVAPRTDCERALVAIWEELLGMDGIGIDDDFFELGGHSLLATQMISRLRDRFPASLALREIFEHPTIAELAARLETVELLDADSAALRAVLAEIDGLSQEEVARQLELGPSREGVSGE